MYQTEHETDNNSRPLEILKCSVRITVAMFLSLVKSNRKRGCAPQVYKYIFTMYLIKSKVSVIIHTIAHS